MPIVKKVKGNIEEILQEGKIKLLALNLNCVN